MVHPMGFRVEKRETETETERVLTVVILLSEKRERKSFRLKLTHPEVLWYV